MLKVALIFLPLVLALTVLAVLGGGGSAAEARADVIAQTLQVLVSYAGAASSFYLLSLGVRASWGLTAFIWSADLGVKVEPAKVILGSVITSVSTFFLSHERPALCYLSALLLCLHDPGAPWRSRPGASRHYSAPGAGRHRGPGHDWARLRPSVPLAQLDVDTAHDRIAASCPCSTPFS